ncbi:hypothetical protein EDD11_004185 [Mortierella claussenii]|nr:hypothetical protein EDD11_004185 [Mortierella claussenii]
MFRTTARAAASVAVRRPWGSMCCCMQQPKIRFRSTLTAADATNLTEWDLAPVSSYSIPSTALQSHSTLEEPTSLTTEPVILAAPTEPVLETPEPQQKRRRGRPRKVVQIIASEPENNTLASPEKATRKPRIRRSSSANGTSTSDPTSKEKKRSRKTSTARDTDKMIVSDPMDSTAFTTSDTLKESLDIACQRPVSLSDRATFPELEPAPFPRDIHSSMPYTTRDIRDRIIPRVPVSRAHTDLQSFAGLDHNKESTLYRGTLFEYQTQDILRERLGIYTQRSAGTNDLGVDLRGTWFLPLSASPERGDMVRHLKVIVQCKTLNSNIGPKYVRELQGSLSYETQPTMAILAINSEFTKQALLPFKKSLWPMALVVIDVDRNECKKLMWNRAAEKVMHGVQIGTRYDKDDDGTFVPKPTLCFQGNLIKRLPGPYLNDPNSDQEPKEPVDYGISDRNISTEPEHLHQAPNVYSRVDSEEQQDKDNDNGSIPLSSARLDMHSWTMPRPSHELTTTLPE